MRYLLFVVFLTFIVACGGGGGGSSPVPPGGKTLQKIEITPFVSSIALNTSLELTATGIYSDKSTADITGTVTWTAVDPTIFSFSGEEGEEGLARAVKVGATSVRASLENVNGSLAITVKNLTLNSLTAEPPNVTLAVSGQAPLKILGQFNDASIQNVTHDVTFDSAHEAIATVDEDNTIVAHAQGSTTITASMAGVDVDINVTVTNATLEGIEVSPLAFTLPKGIIKDYTATGIYSDSSKKDLTDQVVWTSSDTSIATMSGNTVTAVKAGQVIINAVFGAYSAQSTLTVTDTVLEGIEISPSSVELASGLGYQLKANGFFADSSVVDITGQVIWASGNEDVVKVHNNDDEKGLIQAVAVGTATITAAYGGFAGESHITVNADTVDSLEILWPGTPMATGTSAQFQVRGMFGAEARDLTADALWTSSDSSVLSVGNGESGGFVTAHAPGTAELTAQFGGVSTAVTVTVTSAVLDSITIEPQDYSSPTGLSVQYTATGHFSDASEQDLTNQVVWTVANTTVARILNLKGSSGMLHTFAAGTTTVTAEFGSKLTQTSLTVTGESLVRLRFAPTYGALETGATMAMKLEGVFSDGSSRDLSAQAVWLSLDSSVVTVSNTDGSKGNLAGVAVGTSYVVAALGDLGLATPIWVLKPVASLVITSESGIFTIPEGWGGLFKATAHYVDGTNEDVTGKVFWSSSNTNVAAFVDYGRVVGRANGSTDISVSLSGIVRDTENLAVVVITSLEMSVDNLGEGKFQFRAWGMWGGADDDPFEFTDAVAWSSSNTSVMTISNTAGEKGLAQAISAGACNITAVYEDLTVSKPVTITAAK